MTELTYCNCACCGCLLLGDSWRRAWLELQAQGRLRRGHPPPVWGRHLGRPYCQRCLGDHYSRPQRRSSSGRRRQRHFHDGDSNGVSHDNAIRILEDQRE